MLTAAASMAALSPAAIAAWRAATLRDEVGDSGLHRGVFGLEICDGGVQIVNGSHGGI